MKYLILIAFISYFVYNGQSLVIFYFNDLNFLFKNEIMFILQPLNNFLKSNSTNNQTENKTLPTPPNLKDIQENLFDGDIILPKVGFKIRIL